MLSVMWEGCLREKLSQPGSILHTSHSFSHGFEGQDSPVNLLVAACSSGGWMGQWVVGQLISCWT